MKAKIKMVWHKNNIVLKTHAFLMRSWRLISRNVERNLHFKTLKRTYFGFSLPVPRLICICFHEELLGESEASMIAQDLHVC